MSLSLAWHVLTEFLEFSSSGLTSSSSLLPSRGGLVLASGSRPQAHSSRRSSSSSTLVSPHRPRQAHVPLISVFRHLCGARAQRRESSNLEYATLVHVVRAGGWRTVLLVRYSAIPTHRMCCDILTFADPEHTCSVDSSFRGMRPWVLAVSICVGAVASETALQVVYRIRARTSRHQCVISAFATSTQ
jgi:hypothetical protein